MIIILIDWLACTSPFITASTFFISTKSKTFMSNESMPIGGLDGWLPDKGLHLLTMSYSESITANFHGNTNYVIPSN